MEHVPAKFQENTAMCYTISAKTKRDGHTDGWTDRRGGIQYREGGGGGVERGYLDICYLIF